MAALHSRCGNYILQLSFRLLLLFLPRLFSAVADWMSIILPHMMRPQCEFRIQVWYVLHTACWKYRTQKLRKKSLSMHHRTTLFGYILATKARIDNWKNLLNSNISSTCSHNMLNISPLTAEIDWRVCSAPAKFNGFRILASLLHRRRSMEVNQICMMFGRLLRRYSIYTFLVLLPRNRILPGV